MEIGSLLSIRNNDFAQRTRSAMSAQSYTSLTPMSAAGHSLAASHCSEIFCSCCGRKPAKFRGEQITSIGWVPITTCRWCEASATRFRNSQNTLL
jgi:hypothetical protein